MPTAPSAQPSTGPAAPGSPGAPEARDALEAASPRWLVVRGVTAVLFGVLAVALPFVRRSRR